MIESPNEVDTLKTYQALLISKREVSPTCISKINGGTPSFYDSNCKFSKVFLLSVWNESTNSVNYRYLLHNCFLTNMSNFARDEMSKVDTLRL